MDIEAGSLVASLIVSSIGFVVFGYGKRVQRLPQVLVGLLLMGFPYFVPNVPIMRHRGGAARWTVARDPLRGVASC